jgi:hypothetical protein
MLGGESRIVVIVKTEVFIGLAVIIADFLLSDLLLALALFDRAPLENHTGWFLLQNFWRRAVAFFVDD